ncbi:MAG: molybdate ABC transporter permease subunit [Firmicutes bacterium]|nr:molybdate ABC transporter permease subunit [Bacillota bacterium]
MDWFPLLNSIRISLIASVLTFFVGIGAAYGLRNVRPWLKAIIDCVLTLPLVLPPTVVGFFLLMTFSPKRPLGAFLLEHFGIRLVMTWPASILAVAVVTFPLMYRTARGAFESFDYGLADAGYSLGLTRRQVFWHIMLPCCRKGVLAGFVLAFARGLGEYGATSMISGYTPGRTATISTTVYQLWRTNDERGAMFWVLINLAISTVVLLTVNMLEARQKKAVKR